MNSLVATNDGSADEHQFDDVFFNLIRARVYGPEDDRSSSGGSSSRAGSVQNLSVFERVVSTQAPILESILLYLPTESIFAVYQTSRFLRDFLERYPTAWQYLSFRVPFAPGDTGILPRIFRTYSLDQLLRYTLMPLSSCLRSLELDNTAISGMPLISTVLDMQRDTLEHLSVRGCKNVSLKYHIIPYLTMFALQDDAANRRSSHRRPRLALKSLYAYRCRHHRRRPYFNTSLFRKDSDSEPTHDLVNLCHKLGIWTDTAWCPTPASRCFRRQDYVEMRRTTMVPMVYVVFDRLWRSKNLNGRMPKSSETTCEEWQHDRDGRLWDHDEYGYRGEALGTHEGPSMGEGKTVPTHLRRSHRMFVEDVRCAGCDELIQERCEQCSVLMHCVGCRKTLCHSCAFDRPFPRAKNTGLSRESELWWAPNAPISPCLMQEPSLPSVVNNNIPPPSPLLSFRWCCLEPVFTGGGGITVGPPGEGVDRLRAVPLPRGEGWEDPEFSGNSRRKTPESTNSLHNYKPWPDNPQEMMRWLLGQPSHLTPPCRNLCQACFESPQWKVSCKRCLKPLCVEHDLRGLRLRICGYRDLVMEKDSIDSAVAQDQKTSSQYDPHADRWPSSFQPFPSSPSSLSQDGAGYTMPPRQTTTEALASGAPFNIPPLPRVEDDYSAAATVETTTTPRTASATDSAVASRSSTPSSLYQSRSQHAKWNGCNSFFCPASRVTGDHRDYCDSVLHRCEECNVNVCQVCHDASRPCNCAYCSEKFTCPNCYLVRLKKGACIRSIEEEENRLSMSTPTLHDLHVFEKDLIDILDQDGAQSMKANGGSAAESPLAEEMPESTEAGDDTGNADGNEANGTTQPVIHEPADE